MFTVKDNMSGFSLVETVTAMGIMLIALSFVAVELLTVEKYRFQNVRRRETLAAAEAVQTLLRPAIQQGAIELLELFKISCNQAGTSLVTCTTDDSEDNRTPHTLTTWRETR